MPTSPETGKLQEKRGGRNEDLKKSAKQQISSILSLSLLQQFILFIFYVISMMLWFDNMHFAQWMLCFSSALAVFKKLVWAGSFKPWKTVVNGHWRNRNSKYYFLGEEITSVTSWALSYSLSQVTNQVTNERMGKCLSILLRLKLTKDDLEGHFSPRLHKKIILK